MKFVEIYTDGACSGNPGPGGYGTILRFNGKEKELSEGFKETTNNRMELKAVLAGLAALKEKCEVKIYSDSKYIVDAINKGWLKKWKKNGWVRGKKDELKNKDLWKEADSLLSQHDVTIEWVKGHSGHEENERCDQLAVNASKGESLKDDEPFTINLEKN